MYILYVYVYVLGANIYAKINYIQQVQVLIYYRDNSHKTNTRQTISKMNARMAAVNET